MSIAGGRREAVSSTIVDIYVNMSYIFEGVIWIKYCITPVSP